VAVEDALRRAEFLADLGRHDDADRLLAQVPAEDPDNEPGLTLLSRGLVARKRFGEAEAVAWQVLRAHPVLSVGSPSRQCRSRSRWPGWNSWASRARGPGTIAPAGLARGRRHPRVPATFQPGADVCG
jgi:hypothetical protein